MSTEQTKGEFLKEKMLNMARWVTQEVGAENLPVDIITGIDGRSALEVTMLAGALEANKSLITQRNWCALVQLMAEKNAPSEVQEVVVAVQRREAMHSKFWRYIELFADVSAQ